MLLTLLFFIFLHVLLPVYYNITRCHMQVHLFRKNIPIVISFSQLYKPTFYSSHLTHNISHGSDAIIWIFHLPWWKYSYLTWLSIADSYSCQHLNTETLSISYSTYLYIRLVCHKLHLACISTTSRLIFTN